MLECQALKTLLSKKRGKNLHCQCFLRDTPVILRGSSADFFENDCKMTLRGKAADQRNFRNRIITSGKEPFCFNDPDVLQIIGKIDFTLFPEQMGKSGFT